MYTSEKVDHIKTRSFLIAQYLGGVLGLVFFHLQHQVNDGFWKHIDNEDPVARTYYELVNCYRLVEDKVGYWKGGNSLWNTLYDEKRNNACEPVFNHAVIR